MCRIDHRLIGNFDYRGQLRISAFKTMRDYLDSSIAGSKSVV